MEERSPALALHPVPLTGVWISTLDKPQAYTPKQLDLACKLAGVLNRGELVLAIPPEGQQ